MNKIIALFLSVIILIAIEKTAINSKNYNNGLNAGEFLLFGAGARSISLGGAYTAVSGDIFSSNRNPAGLADLDSIKLGFMHHTLAEDIKINYVSVGMPAFEKNHYAAFSVNYGNYGEEDVTIYALDPSNPWADAKTNEKFKGSDLTLQTSYSIKKGKKFLFGISGKYISQKIYGYKAAAIAIDFGMIIKLKNNIKVGAGIFNLGTKLKFDQKSEPLPIQIKTGFTTNLFDKEFITLNGDIIYTKNEKLDYCLGTEINPLSLISFRCGYNSVNETDNGLVFGLGFKLDKLNIDYAYEPFGDFGNSHKFSIDYSFGKSSELADNTIKNNSSYEIKQENSSIYQKNNFIELNELMKSGYRVYLKKDYFNALLLFNSAVQINPYHINARLWMAYCHAMLGNYKAAINEYHIILQIEPTNIIAEKSLKLLKQNNNGVK